jgi:CheY-like chemotaxis protein
MSFTERTNSELVLNNQRVLVVEDFGAASSVGTPLQRLDSMDLFGRAFRRVGAVVDVRASVHLAKQRLVQLATQQRLPTILLTDFHLMGAGTGVDLAVWLRAEAAFQHIPCFLMTASMHQAEQKALSLNTSLGALFDSRYTKPVNLPQLITDMAEKVSIPQT